jgi:hypothetical protein
MGAVTVYQKTDIDTLLSAKVNTTDAPELIRDTVGATLVAGTNVTLSVNDAADTITVSATAGSALDATASSKGVVQLAGDLTGTAAAPVLTATGVSAGSVGSSTQIPVLTIDAKGRVTAKTSVAVSGGSGGSSGPNDSLVYNAAAHGITTSLSDIGPTLNSLITTVNAGGGGVIVFPPGNYNVGTTIMLKQGVYLMSLAPNHGYVAASPSAQSVKFSQNSGTTGWLIDSNGGWSFGIQGIDLSGQGAGCGGIRMRGAYWCAVKQSMANGFGLGGFVQTAPSGGGSAGFACVYEDLMTTNCVDSGVGQYTGAFDIDGTDHYVSRCEFACRALASGIANSNKYVTAVVLRGSNHFVDTIVGETSDTGFYITATKSRFVNLRADTNNGDGFYVLGGTNDFTNCDSIGNGQAGSNQYDGWIIDNGAWRCRFVACTVSLAGSIKVRYGFNEQTNIAQTVYAPVFTACSVEDAGTARWYQPNGSFAGVTFTGTMRPTMSATPDAYETALLDTANFTSATTITNFAGGAEGQHMRVIGNANITIANGSTIKTSTGANVTMLANKIYSFTYYHGTWYGA